MKIRDTHFLRFYLPSKRRIKFDFSLNHVSNTVAVSEDESSQKNWAGNPAKLPKVLWKKRNSSKNPFLIKFKKLNLFWPKESYGRPTVIRNKEYPPDKQEVLYKTGIVEKRPTLYGTLNLVYPFLPLLQDIR